MGPAPATVTSSSSQSSEAASFSDDEISSPEYEADAEMNKRPKRPKLIDVQLPRNIMNSPQVAAALDRTNTTPGQAMHLISAVLKSVQKDGESLDLNEVTLSRGSVSLLCASTFPRSSPPAGVARRLTTLWPRKPWTPWTDTAGTWPPLWSCSASSVRRCRMTPRPGWQRGSCHSRDPRRPEWTFPSFPL